MQTISMSIRRSLVPKQRGNDKRRLLDGLVLGDCTMVCWIGWCGAERDGVWI